MTDEERVLFRIVASNKSGFCVQFGEWADRLPLEGVIQAMELTADRLRYEAAAMRKNAEARQRGSFNVH